MNSCTTVDEHIDMVGVDRIVNLAKAAGASKVYVFHVFPRNWASEAGVRGPDYHKNDFESRGRKVDVEVFWRQAEEE